MTNFLAMALPLAPAPSGGKAQPSASALAANPDVASVRPGYLSDALALAVDAIPQAVYVGNARGVVHCNRPALQMLGLREWRELPKTAQDWVARFRLRRQRDGATVQADSLPFVRALRGEQAELEMWLTPAAGHDLCVRATAFPVWRNGRIAGVLAINHDLTQQLNLERQRDSLARAKHALQGRDEELRALLRDAQAARESARQANRAREEFLATVSHELRTPLTAILGWATVLERGQPDPQKVSHGLASIARNARVQARLIEQLLDLNRLQAGLLELQCESLEPQEFVDAAVRSVQPEASAKDVRVTAEPGPALGMVHGDAQRLQQVVANLLGNAVKFTPSGGDVAVRLYRQGEQLAIQVDDTGCGIAPEGVARIFESFRQADAGSTRRHGGLGIGLAIVHELVQLHGGSVQAGSRGRGMGARFTVLLPVAADAGTGNVEHAGTGDVRDAATRKVEHAVAGDFGEAGTADVVDADVPDGAQAAAMQALSATGQGRLDGLTLVLVDDEPDGRELAAHALTEAGARVLAAASAREGFDLFRRHRPHVLLSDIAMAEHDGYDLLRWIRALDTGEGGETPAVAITAFAAPADVQRTLRAGFQAHLAKPLEPDSLVAAVAGLVPDGG